jgi:hypothetical protein
LYLLPLSQALLCGVFFFLLLLLERAARLIEEELARCFSVLYYYFDGRLDCLDCLMGDVTLSLSLTLFFLRCSRSLGTLLLAARSSVCVASARPRAVVPVSSWPSMRIATTAASATSPTCSRPLPSKSNIDT